MKKFAQMSVEKMPDVGKSGISFVWKNLPSVGFNKPAILPFICQRMPFIRYSGFTLVELLVTMAVVAILVAFVMPNMRAMIQNSRIMTLTSDVLSDVHLARSEAIKRATNVRICTWNSTTTPTAPSCNGAGNWSVGRVIWADDNNNGALDPGELVRSRGGLTPMTLTPVAAIDPVVFNSRGSPTSAAEFRLCDDRGPTFAKFIRISATGQAMVSATTPVTTCP